MPILLLILQCLCWSKNITDAKAVTAGGEHSCAVHEDGAISCWGNNYDGQLGNGQGGEDVFSSIPVSVAGITDAEAVSAGWDYSCALHQDGTVSCWGHSFTGQLGGTHDEEFQAEIEELIEEAEQPGASSTLTEELLRLRLQVYAQAYALVPVRIEGITDATVYCFKLETFLRASRRRHHILLGKQPERTARQQKKQRRRSRASFFGAC